MLTNINYTVSSCIKWSNLVDNNSCPCLQELNRVRRAAIQYGFPSLLLGVCSVLEREALALPQSALPEGALQLQHAAMALKVAADAAMDPNNTDNKHHSNIMPLRTSYQIWYIIYLFCNNVYSWVRRILIRTFKIMIRIRSLVRSCWILQFHCVLKSSSSRNYLRYEVNRNTLNRTAEAGVRSCEFPGPHCRNRRSAVKGVPWTSLPKQKQFGHGISLYLTAEAEGVRSWEFPGPHCQSRKSAAMGVP